MEDFNSDEDCSEVRFQFLDNWIRGGLSVHSISTHFLFRIAIICINKNKMRCRFQFDNILSFEHATLACSKAVFTTQSEQK